MQYSRETIVVWANQKQDGHIDIEITLKSNCHNISTHGDLKCHGDHFGKVPKDYKMNYICTLYDDLTCSYSGKVNLVLADWKSW